MTQSVDNTAAEIPGVIRDPITAANLLRVNADGSINATVTGGAGVTSVAAGGGVVVSPSPIVGTGTVTTLVLPISVGASKSPTSANHNATYLLDASAGSAIVLPAATASGMKFRFVTKTIPTTGNHTISSKAASGTMIGAIVAPLIGTGVFQFPAVAGNNAVTFNGTTSGGSVLGDYVEVQDIATNIWAVTGFGSQTGGQASPFSTT